MIKTQKLHHLSIVIILFCLFLLGPGLVMAEDEEGEVLPFRGKVVYLDFDGGFWGVVTTDGKKYYFPKGVGNEF